MTTSHKAHQEARRSRDDTEKLAWSFWDHISANRLDDALALLDDEGTWWPASLRAEVPMRQMKKALREIYEIVPMTFDHIDTIVEGSQVAAMAESHAELPGGGKYNNVYTFVMTLHPERDVITGIREYADTHHSSVTLIPALAAETKRRGGRSALAGVIEERQANLPDLP
jgi:ketosteroid isomerase-like protein